MKFILYLGATVGGLLGGYLPVLLWNANAFGFESIIGGLVGGMAGILAGYYAGKYFDL